MGTSDAGHSFYETTKIEADGRFRGNVHEKAVTVQAHFVPPIGFGECVSKERHVRQLTSRRRRGPENEHF